MESAKVKMTMTEFIASKIRSMEWDRFNEPPNTHDDAEDIAEVAIQASSEFMEKCLFPNEDHR